MISFSKVCNVGCNCFHYFNCSPLNGLETMCGYLSLTLLIHLKDNQHCASNQQRTALTAQCRCVFTHTSQQPFPAAFRYLDVSGVPLAVPPRAADAREGSLWMVELVIVGVEEKCGEGLLQAQEREKKYFRRSLGPLECVQTTARSQRSQAGEERTYYSEHPHQC